MSTERDGAIAVVGWQARGAAATLLVIEDVPVQVCPHCGASYLLAETLHEIERIKLLRRSLAKTRNVAVANSG